MANELTINGSIQFDDNDSAPIAVDVVDLLVSLTTSRPIRYRMQVATTEEAVPLGELATLGWAIFVNRDTTNFVELRTGTGGTKFAKLKAGEPAMFRFGSGISAPYIIADTAACEVDIFIAPV